MEDSAAQGAESTPAHWKLLGTALWGLAIAAAFFALQLITTVVVVARGKGVLNEDQILALLKSSDGAGNALAISTFVTTLICVPMVVAAAALKKRSSITDYFALRPVPVKAMVSWLLAFAIVLALCDGLSLALGRPLVPDFMVKTYKTTEPVWMIWIALLLAAPLFEEAFVRGFLFKGLASSFFGPAGAIAITAGLWASIHLQYDLYEIGAIFLFGLLLGYARLRSGSLVVPLAMHAAANAIATVETAFLF